MIEQPKANLKMANMKLCSVISVLILWAGMATAQGRVANWTSTEQLDGFVHGIYALPVNNSIELISLHYDTFSFQTGQGDPIRIDAYAPDAGTFFLHLDERIIGKYYRLESNPGERVQSGWNSMGPIPVDGILRFLNIPKDNLAALLHFGEDDSDYLLPVFVYTSSAIHSARNVRAVFRIGRAISRGRYQVFAGEYAGVLPDKEPEQTGNITRKYAGSLLELSIDRQQLGTYEGWVTVQLELQEKNKTTKIPLRFYFYHPRL